MTANKSHALQEFIVVDVRKLTVVSIQIGTTRPLGLYFYRLLSTR